MFYPLQLAVLKSEGGGLVEENMQVGGEPSQKQIVLLCNPESLICKLLPRANKRSLLKRNGIFPSCHRVKKLLQYVVVRYRVEPCVMRRPGNLYITADVVHFEHPIW